MSHSDKPDSDFKLDKLSDQLRDSLSNLDDTNKPDYREFDLGSPVSPLRTRASGLSATTTTTTTTGTSSSSSSSGSVSGRNANNTAPRRSHSGDLSVSSDSSPTVGTRNRKPSHSRSDSTSTTTTPTTHPLIYSGQSSVNSPPPSNVIPPTGNICPSGRIARPAVNPPPRVTKFDVLGSGGGIYGHGSIMRRTSTSTVAASSSGSPKSVSVGGDSMRKAMQSSDPEDLKNAGNDMYKKGHFKEALALYDKAIYLAPRNAAYRCNRSAALTGLGRIAEAAKDCEESIRLDPTYWRARQRLGSLLISLGLVKNARDHLFSTGQQPVMSEVKKLQAVEKHINQCADARKVGDWTSVLRESHAAITAGAAVCAQLFMCRVEAYLKLSQVEDAEACFLNTPKSEQTTSSSQTRFFGILSDAYPLFVKAQIEMALGRFENAVAAIEKAGKIDPRNDEVSVLLYNYKLVARARTRGNDLFKSDRFTEASAAYGEGLKLDALNPVLYGNRAACWFKLGLWERSLEDCNRALCIHPNYTKALLRRAASNTKLEKWSDAVRDYEVLRRELPDDNGVAESYFHAQIALKKSKGEDVNNMKFGGEVEEVTGLEQFKAAISFPGVSVVHFSVASNLNCKQISPFFDSLCSRYPSISFLKVDITERQAIAEAENVRIVPTFKIYKNGTRVKEMVCPSQEMLEHSVRHYGLSSQ